MQPLPLLVTLLSLLSDEAAVWMDVYLQPVGFPVPSSVLVPGLGRRLFLVRPLPPSPTRSHRSRASINYKSPVTEAGNL